LSWGKTFKRVSATVIDVSGARSQVSGSKGDGLIRNEADAFKALPAVRAFHVGSDQNIQREELRREVDGGLA
jgi:hypothetical protein